MKKQILALSFGVVSLGAFAQKAELKAAEKAIKKQNYSEAMASISAAEKLISNADDKYKCKFYGSTIIRHLLKLILFNKFINTLYPIDKSELFF